MSEIVEALAPGLDPAQPRSVTSESSDLSLTTLVLLQN